MFSRPHENPAAQRHVRSHDANQRHAVDVMSLRDHLRADQHVERAFVQRIQRTLEIFPPAHRVAIKAPDARLRKHAVQQLFQLFRSRPDKINVLATAMRTLLGDLRHVSAIMAFHLVFAFVVRHRDGAILALQRLAARAAQHHRRVSAPVEQHHDLLFLFQPLANFLRQFA